LEEKIGWIRFLVAVPTPSFSSFVAGILGYMAKRHQSRCIAECVRAILRATVMAMAMAMAMEAEQIGGRQ